MLAPRNVWIALALVYALFFSWYTSFGGPLTEAEIEEYLALVPDDAPPEQVAVWRRFMETDTGDDFAMINMIDLRDEPLQVEGVEPGETSEEVMAKYTTPFLGHALRAAAHPVLLGTTETPAVDRWGIEGAEHWTNGGIVRYRSRRDLMEQVRYAGPLDIHQFKVAALEKTIAYPLDPWFQLGDPRLLLALLFGNLGLAWHLSQATRARS